MNQSSRIEISPATVEDVPAMDRFLQELATFLGEPESYGGNKKNLQRYGFGEHKSFHALIARDNDMPVGMTVFFPEYSTWQGKPGVFIQDLYVAANYRGSGVGADLVSATLAFARSRWDGSYMRLCADRQNDSAIRFYERLGFRIDRENYILTRNGNGDPDSVVNVSVHR